LGAYQNEPFPMDDFRAKRSAEIFENGDGYEGEWNSENQMHGVGRYVTQIGELYEGSFIANTMQGNGRYIYEDGSWYVGEFMAWKRNQ
jgi:hypothetical protein